MWFQPRRTVHTIGRHLSHAVNRGLHLASHVDRGIQALRPYFDKARPLLDSLGFNSGHAQKALENYDEIRNILTR